MSEEITVLLFLHNEVKAWHLLQQVCQAIQCQTIPVFVTVIFDTETPMEELAFVKAFNFDRYLCAPRSLLHNLPMTHVWAYDQCDTEFVAIVQSDDPPFLIRCERQSSILHDHPTAAMTCAGFYTITNEILNTTTPNIFYETEPCGLNVGYPSGWMLRKSVLPHLPAITEYAFPRAWDWDPWMLLVIAKEKDILLHHEKLFTYNLQANNKSASISDKERELRFNELCDFYHQIREQVHPHLKVI